MEILKLFEDSLAYPMKDWNKLLKFGALILIMSIVSILGPIGFILSHLNVDIMVSGVNSILAVLSILSTAIILIIFGSIISGYNLNITKNTINNVDSKIPELNLAKNFIDGIKVVVLYIIYFIVPIIMALIIAYGTGLFHYMYQLGIILLTQGAIDLTYYPLLHGLDFSFRLVVAIAPIFFIVFGLLFLIGKAILAETGSLLEASNIVNIFKKIDEIGWGDYIAWLIMAMVILMVIFIFTSFVTIIPLIGIIIAILVLIPYVNMFGARAIGLIYNESKISSSNNESKISSSNNGD
ncbi:MAG: DUF4013 domain-containing protein [Methanobrevibacter sp.]|nr:DUF4013 domain-containing protein [Methanobrevibacter sp.]